MNGSAAPEHFDNSHDPTFATGGRWLGSVSSPLLKVIDTIQRSYFIGSNDSLGYFDELAWSLDGQWLVAPTGDKGQLAVVESTELVPIDPGAAEPAPTTVKPRILPGQEWAHPTFRRDGKVVVAQLTPEGNWINQVLDVETGETFPEERREYAGWLIGQDHDPTGEWLLTVTGEGEGEAGTVQWVGPGSGSGALVGRYWAASW